MVLPISGGKQPSRSTDKFYLLPFCESERKNLLGMSVWHLWRRILTLQGPSVGSSCHDGEQSLGHSDHGALNQNNTHQQSSNIDFRSSLFQRRTEFRCDLCFWIWRNKKELLLYWCTDFVLVYVFLMFYSAFKEKSNIYTVVNIYIHRSGTKLNGLAQKQVTKIIHIGFNQHSDYLPILSQMMDEFSP